MEEKKNFGLVIAPNWVGDAVMCLPALGALARARPDLDWQVAARPRVAGVFQAAARAAGGRDWPVLMPGDAPGGEDGRMPDGEDGWAPSGGPSGKNNGEPRREHRREHAREPGWRQLWAMRRAFRGQPPELAVVFPNSLYSALLARASGARQTVGYSRDGRGPLLSTAPAPPRPGSTPPHEAFYYLELLRRAGLLPALPGAVAELRAPLAASPAAVSHWQERLAAWPPAPGGGRLAIHAGASFGHAKRWLPERFAATAAELAARGHAVLFIGSVAEAPLAEALAAQVAAAGGAGSAGPVVSLAGQTDLDGLVALLSHCQLLIANDSGPMHLAAGVATPVLAIFGSTNARETHPLAPPGSWRLIQAPGIACSPCKRRECPIDHRCMTRVEVSEVVAAAEDMMARARVG